MPYKISPVYRIRYRNEESQAIVDAAVEEGTSDLQDPYDTT